MATIELLMADHILTLEFNILVMAGNILSLAETKQRR